MPHWMSIEVIDGSSAASLWADAHGDALVESALSTGAVDWSWHRHTWGVVFEVAFTDEEAWERFRGLHGVRAALDAVPDPDFGLVISRGRGGRARAAEQRGPAGVTGAGAAALPLPFDLFGEDEWRVSPADLLDLRRLSLAR